MNRDWLPISRVLRFAFVVGAGSITATIRVFIARLASDRVSVGAGAAMVQIAVVARG